MIKKLFSVILFGCVILSITYELKAQDTNALVFKIRGHYSQINSGLKKYRKVKKDAVGFSLEGGEMTAYFSGKELKKISAVFYGEMHRTNVDYYFNEGKLIFIFQSRGNYNKPMSGKIVSREEDRFYFNEDALVKWQSGKKDRGLDEEEAKEMEKQLLEDTRKLVQIASS